MGRSGSGSGSGSDSDSVSDSGSVSCAAGYDAPMNCARYAMALLLAGACGGAVDPVTRADVPPPLYTAAPANAPAPNNACEATVTDDAGADGGLGTVNGWLEPPTIQGVVRDHFGVFRRCYEAALPANPNLGGRVSVKFVIGRDGAVCSAQDAASELPDPSVVACIVRGFRALQFPPPTGGVVTVVYPIIFNPGNDAQDAAAPLPAADAGIASTTMDAAAGIPFDRAAAATSLASSASQSSVCGTKSGPHGSGHVKVTFGTDGRATRAEGTTPQARPVSLVVGGAAFGPTAGGSGQVVGVANVVEIDARVHGA